MFACADYGEVLTGIRWTRWTARNASGIGVLNYKYCVPNCAEGGRRQSDDTTVTLSTPVSILRDARYGPRPVLSPFPPIWRGYGSPSAWQPSRADSHVRSDQS